MPALWQGGEHSSIQKKPTAVHGLLADLPTLRQFFGYLWWWLGWKRCRLEWPYGREFCRRTLLLKQPEIQYGQTRKLLYVPPSNKKRCKYMQIIHLIGILCCTDEYVILITVVWGNYRVVPRGNTQPFQRLLADEEEGTRSWTWTL